MKKLSLILIILLTISISCKRDSLISKDTFEPNFELPKPIRLVKPVGFPPFPSTDLVLSEEGIELGRKLFFDPILSADNTLSCAGCHSPERAFTDDGKAVSVGIDGIAGSKNSMALFNLAWSPSMFWDGRRPTLKAQAFDPVVDPIEMHHTWPNALKALKGDPVYPELFQKVFGVEDFDSSHVVDAIAQFEMTLISADSEYDKLVRLTGNDFTNTVPPFADPDAIAGFKIFNSEPKRPDGSGSPGGDCFHCHGSSGNILFTSNQFMNNGLDADPSPGLYRVTKNPADYGKFKAPSMRNLSFTAPYMHDGRFQTLEEVVDFYNEGVNASSPNLSSFMKKTNRLANGLQLTDTEKRQLIAFLKTLDDSTFIENPAFKNPNLR